MQHPHPTDPGHEKLPTSAVVAMIVFGVLALVIMWLAMFSDPITSPPDGRLTPVTADHAGVTEQRLTLTDGRTVCGSARPAATT